MLLYKIWKETDDENETEKIIYFLLLRVLRALRGKI